MHTMYTKIYAANMESPTLALGGHYIYKHCTSITYMKIYAGNTEGPILSSLYTSVMCT